MMCMRSLFGAAVAAVLAAGAFGQSIEPAIFVANNGNLEGSVTSFTINPDGTLSFVQKLVTGTTPTTSQPVHGTNCYTIAISPDGKHLAVGHASGTTGQWLTIMEVHPDATISIANHFVVPNTPLDLVWMDNEHIAVMESNASVLPSRVRVWRYNAATNTVLQAAIKDTGAFSTSVAMDPLGKYLYTQATSGTASPNQISVWSILPGGAIELSHNLVAPAFPMGLGVSPNGKWIYGAGGISAGGKAIVGANIDHENGTLSFMPNSPFTSPGSSPKQVVVSSDNAFAIAGHGTDATARTFAIDQTTGELTATGHWYKVGGQGDMGLIEVLGDNFFTTRRYSSTIWGPVGVLSFVLGADGSINHVETVSTQGIHPHDVATWPGAGSTCPGDLTGDDGVGVADLLALLAAWGPNPGHAADLTGDGNVGVADLLALLAAWGPCP